MPKAQEWLNNNYPLEIRNNITKLDLRSKGLEGEIAIKNWLNLERLNCGFNQLTDIKIANCPKLNFFSVRNCQLSTVSINNCPEIGYFNIKKNSLSDITFISSINPEKLTFLDLGDNNFYRQDLSVFSHLINLEEFYFGNSFSGSLEPLKNLTKLKSLGIFTPNIDSGLEYLTATLEKFYCHNLDKESDTSLKIWEELKNYPTEDSFKFTCYDYQAWRKDNAERIELANIDKVTLFKQFKSLEEERKEMKEKINQLQEEMKNLERKLQSNPNSPTFLISPNFSNISTGSISAQQGHAVIGNTLGDNPNFSHETTNRQQENKVIERKIEAKIEQPLKTKTWKQLLIKKS